MILILLVVCAVLVFVLVLVLAHLDDKTNGRSSPGEWSDGAEFDPVDPLHRTWPRDGGRARHLVPLVKIPHQRGPALPPRTARRTR